jgi:hypothetical protein
MLTIFIQGMETAFKGMGFEVQTHELSHFHDDYGLDAGDDEDEDEDDEDDEDEDEEEYSDEEGSEEDEDEN